MSRQDQGERESPRPPLKKNGWVSQRFKPFPVELPNVDVKQEKKRYKSKQNINLTFDDLPKIRKKASIKKVESKLSPYWYPLLGNSYLGIQETFASRIQNLAQGMLNPGND